MLHATVLRRDFLSISSVSISRQSTFIHEGVKNHRDRPHVWKYRRFSSCAKSSCKEERSAAAQNSVAQYLSQLQQKYSSGLEGDVTVNGSGRHQGTFVQWQLHWRSSDAAFVERVQGKELSYCWGYDGAGVCWEEDDSGCIRTLQLDDREAVLLAGLIRTGSWLSGPGLQLLDIRIVEGNSQYEAQGSYLQAEGITFKPGNYEADGAKAAACSTAVVVDPQLPQHLDQEYATAGLEDMADHADAATAVTTLSLTLRGGQIDAHVQVCEHLWRPIGMTSRVCSDLETWKFLEWQAWEEGLHFPRNTLHHSGCGGLHNYKVATVRQRTVQDIAVDAAKTLVDSSLSMPPQALLPPDTEYLDGTAPDTPAWYSPSGHILVRPTINGRQEGYMIFDTGASGFVIDPKAATDLGLEAFGELHVTGMAGKVRSSFRRGDTLQLGPLVMRRPLFMEMACTGLVRGAPGPVIGIVGYEVFRRAIVEIPPRPQAPPSHFQDPQLAFESGVQTAAAAVAASFVKKRRKPGRLEVSGGTALQYTIRLYHPKEGGQADSQSSWSTGDDRGSRTTREGAKAQPDITPAALTNRAGRSGALGCAQEPISVDWERQGDVRPEELPRLKPPGDAFGSGTKAGCGLVNAPLFWHPLTFIANLPHVEVRFTPGNQQGVQPKTALFMLDSGAGGVDMMFNAKAVREFGMHDFQAGHRFITGVGGESSGRVKVASCTLPWVEMAGVRFEGVRALLASNEGSGGGMELSSYTSGVICGDLLGGCRVVLDYSRERVAIQQCAHHR